MVGNHAQFFLQCSTLVHTALTTIVN